MSNEIKLHDIVMPVLSEMPDSMLRRALAEAFEHGQELLAIIEHAFKTLTAAPHSQHALLQFFASWSNTNNSATSVAGLASRVTLQARKQADPRLAQQLFNTCASLHRVTDEELGALGGTLHADLFHTMATAACSDDQWLLKSFCLPSAQDFKTWLDKLRLREFDLMKGLLSTLMHEIFAHAEVEYILPLFQRWFVDHMGIEPERLQHILAWITERNSGMASKNFAHALDAVQRYSVAMGLALDEHLARSIFNDYLHRKATVMADCLGVLQQQAPRLAMGNRRAQS